MHFRFFIFLSLVWGSCLASKVQAQVYGSGFMAGLKTISVGARRGSNTLGVFRQFSTGLDRFATDPIRSQPDPLAFNSRHWMGIPSRPSIGAPSLRIPAGALLRRVNNRVINNNRSGFPGIGTTNWSSNMLTASTAFASGTDYETGAGFSPGIGYPAATAMPAGRGFMPSTVSGSGLGFSRTLGTSFPYRGLYPASRLPRVPDSRDISQTSVPSRPPFGNTNLTQRNSLLGISSPTIIQKPYLAEKSNLSDRDIRQQRINRSIFGAAQSQRLGQTTIFSTYRSRY